MDSDSDIEITSEQYINIITNFVLQLIKYLDTNKTDIRTLLGGLIQNLTDEDNQEGEKIEIVMIEPFVNKMREIGIQLKSEIEIYCLFSRYKISDEYEIISINLLEKELDNFRKNNVGNNEINAGEDVQVVGVEGNNMKLMEKVQEENEDNVSNEENK